MVNLCEFVLIYSFFIQEKSAKTVKMKALQLAPIQLYLYTCVYTVIRHRILNSIPLQQYRPQVNLQYIQTPSHPLTLSLWFV